MKKFITIFAAASALVLAGCNKQEMAPDTFGEQSVSLTLNATRGDESLATKTSMSLNDEYASIESVWKEGDKVYVYSRKSGELLGDGSESGVLTLVPGTIINQRSSATAQYATSYASFKGKVTIADPDNFTDEMMFVYQGEGRSLSATDGVLTYEIGTTEDIGGLANWDIATATGKIIGSADEASCSVNFSNKVGFGYFTTEGFTDGMKVNYYSGFTLDVKSGTVAGVAGTITLPADKVFYMPLIVGNVNMSSADKIWSENTDEHSAYFGKLGYYGGIKQSKSFTAAAGNYYRLGRNATPAFGPVAFAETEWTCYETLKNSTFNVGTEETPKNVHFTQGNLQYIGSAKNSSGEAAPFWRVAPSQYSYLGSANYKPLSADSGTKMPEDADTDLFGWGEVEPPFLCSNVDAEYQPSIDNPDIDLTTDWSTKFNNGTKLYIEQDKEYDLLAEGEKYFCLTKTEWQNLFENQWYCGTTVTLNDGTSVKGIVICPKSFNEAAAKSLIGGNAVKGKIRTPPTALYSESSLTQDQVDVNGLLFLPAAGNRSGTSLNNVGSGGLYWSTTSSSATNGYSLYFYATSFNSADSNNRYYGFSVRLASSAEN